MDKTEYPKNFNDDPDIKKMLAFQQGDKGAFEELMRKYYPRVLNFIFRYINTRDVAEDLTQEVFLRLYKTADHYTPQARFSTWLFTIAKNLSFNELRRRKKFVGSLDEPIPSSAGNISPQVADPDAIDPKEKISNEEQGKMVQEAIASLPENQRTAVLLRRYEDFSYEQIAKAMDISVQAVKSLLSRAKENLKTKLQRYLSG